MPFLTVLSTAAAALKVEPDAVAGAVMALTAVLVEAAKVRRQLVGSTYRPRVSVYLPALSACLGPLAWSCHQ